MWDENILGCEITSKNRYNVDSGVFRIILMKFLWHSRVIQELVEMLLIFVSWSQYAVACASPQRLQFIGVGQLRHTEPMHVQCFSHFARK